jgi:hypothetical protein
MPQGSGAPMTTLELYLSIAVVALLAFGGWSLWERHQGAQQCINADTAKATQAVVADASKEATQTVADAKEDQTHEEAIVAPIAPAPAYGVQSAPISPGRCPVSKAGSTPSKGSGTPDVRDSGAPGVVPPDWNAFISASVLRARNADAEIRDRDVLLQNLQALCTPKDAQ